MPLDPYSITPNGSINRVKLMSAAGLPEAWRGQTIYQVMGCESLVKRIAEAFPELANQADPVQMFSETYLAQNNPTAKAIADEMGLALGCLLLILKQSEAANREARPEWDDSYWAQWGSIQQVILGGGLMAGTLGQCMLAQAAKMLDGLLSLEIAKYPATLPLIGMARMTRESYPSWVFDYGGTYLKRARVFYRDEKLSSLEQLPSLPIPVFNESSDLFNFMVRAMADTISIDGQPNEPVLINVSLSNYINEGRLANDTPYGRLSYLGENFAQVFSEAVGQRVSYRVSIILVHDGTAAAKAYAGRTKTAIITIGTALGWGFPPPHESLAAVDANFQIQFVD